MEMYMIVTILVGRKGRMNRLLDQLHRWVCPADESLPFPVLEMGKLLGRKLVRGELQRHPNRKNVVWGLPRHPLCRHYRQQGS